MAAQQWSPLDGWTRARRPDEMRYVRGEGWIRRTFDGEQRVRRPKPKYYWTWPKDGKNESKGGRFKDILSGKGPDIHVSISGDKRLHPDDWPHRPRWSHWPDNEIFSWVDEDIDSALEPPRWADRGKKRYDFMTRRYVYPTRSTLSDAYWATEKSINPYRFRDVDGFGWNGKPLGGGLYEYFPYGWHPFIPDLWL